jgi:hypothetical protein
VEYREGLPERPARIAALPLDDRGYPVPYFVSWIDGKPDFRVADMHKLAACVNRGRCWVCGGQLGKFQTFAIGPMCAVNRISSEPPSHRDCAHYAVLACPFLLRPHAKRREANLPDGHHIEEHANMRNPGVILLWTTTLRYRARRAGQNVLFLVPDPVSIEFWSEGREATPAEIFESYDSGVEILREAARKQGAEACAELERMIAEAAPILPERAAVIPS